MPTEVEPEAEPIASLAKLEYTLFRPIKNLADKEWQEERHVQMTAFDMFDKEQAKKYLFEVVWAVSAGEMSSSRAVDLIIGIKLLKSEHQKAFLDALWVASVALDISSNTANRSKDLDNFIHQICLKQKNLKKEEFPMRGIEIIASLEPSLVPSVLNLDNLNLKKKKNQARTKAKLTVPHFNLLREHIEGYTYLGVLLNRFLHVQEDEEAITILITAITEAIGFFSLCIARVLSLVLDVIEQKLDRETPQSFHALRRLLAWFPRNRISEVVLFQAKQLERARQKADGEYRTLAWLAAEKYVDGDEIWREFPNVHDKVYQKLDAAYEKTILDPKSEWDEVAQEYYQLDSPHLRFIAALLSMNCYAMAQRYCSFLDVRPELNYYVQTELLALLSWYLQPLLTDSNCMRPGATSPPNRYHFAPQGVESLTQVKTWDDLHGPVLRSLLEACESTIANDQGLLCGLWRLVKVVMEDAPQDERMDFFIARYLLPACSMSETSPNLCDLIWSVLCDIPVSRRYTIYCQWENMYDTIYPLKVVRRRTVREVKQLLKRVVSKAERQDKFSSQVHYHFAKLCQPNPLVACEVMVKDIEVGFNNNLIVPYIDCTHRIPEICQDVAAFILTRTAFKPRDMQLLNESAMVSTWFENIAEFAGIFFKKHASADLYAFLKILVSRIEASAQPDKRLSDSLVRVILQSLFEHMGGMIVIQDMTEDQTYALAGGPILWQHVAHGDDDAELGELQKSRQRLLKAFQLDTGLIQVLMQALGQQGVTLTNDLKLEEKITNEGGLKLLGVLFDGARSTFLNTVLFLKTACTKEQYRSFVSSFSEIFQLFDPAIAFRVIRPALLPKDPFPYYPVGLEKAGVSKQFYSTFWSLSLRDIHVPSDSYKKVMDGLQKDVAELNKKRESLKTQTYLRHAASDLRKVEQEIDRLSRKYDDFRKEEESYKIAHQKVMYRLQNETKSWITRGGPQATKLFITEMLAPRLLTSVADALYCTYFIKAMIKMRTPNFQLLDFYNNWTTLLTQFMRCSTEKEAEIFGLFLREMMSYILQLRRDEKAFNTQMDGNPVFYRNYYAPDTKDKVMYCKYAELKKGHAKWENRIFKALKPGLESEDWMEKSTALKVLFKTTKVFPMLQKNVEIILDMVQKIAENETRKDIKTFSTSYAVRLRLHKQDWFPDEDKKKEAIPAPKESKEKESKEKEPEKKKEDRKKRDRDDDRKKEDREDRHAKRHRGDKRDDRREDDKNRDAKRRKEESRSGRKDEKRRDDEKSRRDDDKGRREDDKGRREDDKGRREDEKGRKEDDKGRREDDEKTSRREDEKKRASSNSQREDDRAKRAK